MKRILTAQQMQLTDLYTINEVGVPVMVLMEKAAMAVYDYMLETGLDLSRVLVVCGSGNNGGDGVALARILHNKGYRVQFLFAGKEDHASEPCRQQLAIARAYGVPACVEFNPEVGRYTLIVDALFGTGLSREITGHYADLIHRINQSEIPVLSIDIPSGVSGTTGQILGSCIQARHTVSMAFYKSGLLLYPGAAMAGQVSVRDVGIYEMPGKYRPDVFLLEPEDLAGLPVRKAQGNKGTFGKVLLIAGSREIYGAAYMSALAAFRSGAGMVKVLTAPENLPMLKKQLPEAMAESYETPGLKPLLENNLGWADVVGIGCGLGTDDTAYFLLKTLLCHCTKPLLVDADGLNLFAAHPELYELVQCPLIFTPHMGEMSRLSELPVSRLKGEALAMASAFAREHQLCLVMKDARTIIADPEGRLYLHCGGNSGMATAGSGDVLAGVILGCLAQLRDPLKASCYGVLLHGLAGDEGARLEGEAPLMATDIIKAISRVLAR